MELFVLVNDDMTHGLAREGLTVSRARLVWRLHHNGPTTQRELADALDVTPRNVTGFVDGLVASGRVTREPHTTDRRAFADGLDHVLRRVREELRAAGRGGR